MHHLIEDSEIDILKRIIETKLFDSILKYFYKELLDTSILERSLIFLHTFIRNSHKECLLSKKIIYEIINIISAYIYSKNDIILKYCLEILCVLSSNESMEFSETIFKTGIIPKLITFDKLFINLEIDSDKIIDIKNYKIEFPKSILILVLNIIGNILADDKDDKISYVSLLYLFIALKTYV